MAFILSDRVRETSTAPGTGSFTVNGAVQGAQTFASVLTSNADTTWYSATNGTAWETGLLTRTSASVYARTTIFASSNAGAAVNFSSGTVDVFCDLPASKAKVLERLAWSAAAITPPVNDGTALGTTTLMFSDLFLASGGVANFNNGDVTITHASGKLTLAGNFEVSGSIKSNGTTLWWPPQGRLTLATGVPVMSTTQSAKTTIYYTPYVGNQIPLYDGTNMLPTSFAELSVATTDTTKNPAAIGASKVNDWFVWNDAGTLRLSHGPDWTNDTTRAAGTALTLVNGIYLNNASITNGPAASRGTYVGTTRSNSSSQLDFIFGAGAASGTAAWLGVWNMYNRRQVTTTVADTTATWTTATSASARNLNSSATNRISFVSGIAEDGIDVAISAGLLPANAVSAGLSVGFGLDATALDKRTGSQVTNIGGLVMPGSIRHTYAPQLGFHFVQATDAGDGTNAGTVIGNLNSAFVMNWSA